MALLRTGTLGLLSLAMLSPAWGLDDHSPRLKRLDQQIQQVKQQFLDLNRELRQTERELLYPPTQRTEIALTMNVFDFDLSEIELRLNDQTVARHEYTAREVYALRRGGAQDLYLGNLNPGAHVLQAVIRGQFDDSSNQTYEKTIEVAFRKDAKPKNLELRIDRRRRGELGFRVFQREPEE